MPPPYAIERQRTLAEAPQARLREMTLAPGQGLPIHRHSQATDVFYVLEGRVAFTRAAEELKLESGQAVAVEPGVAHGMKNNGPGAARVLLWQGCGAYDFLIVEGAAQP